MRRPPVIVTIFGITGDLSRKKLLPAVYNLWVEGQFDSGLHLIGFGRREFSPSDFSQFIKEILDSAPNLAAKDKKSIDEFLGRCVYCRGQLDGDGDFTALKELVSNIGKQYSRKSLNIFYFAIAPEFYGRVADRLAAANLHVPPSAEAPSPCLMIEKPFGTSWQSAIELNRQLRANFHDSQIFLIDHFLGKGTMRYLADYRFRHKTLEHFWHARFIESITITMAETDGIGSRAGYFDHTGIIRDIFQNHALSFVAGLTMEPPASESEQGVKLARLNALKRGHARLLEVGQYTGYRREAGVARDSRTETSARIELTLTSRRWRGLPVILTIGKRMAQKLTEAVIHFRDCDGVHPRPPRLLTVRVQPDPAIITTYNDENKSTIIKIPPSLCRANAHEQLLLDCVNGDRTYFLSLNEALAAWKITDPLTTAKDTYVLGEY